MLVGGRVSLDARRLTSRNRVGTRTTFLEAASAIGNLRACQRRPAPTCASACCHCLFLLATSFDYLKKEMFPSCLFASLWHGHGLGTPHLVSVPQRADCCSRDVLVRAGRLWMKPLLSCVSRFNRWCALGRFRRTRLSHLTPTSTTGTSQPPC